MRDPGQLICGDYGDWGYWPLKAYITVEAERVMWSNFHQPHRNDEYQLPLLHYKELGQFVFDWRQYKAKLAKCWPLDTYQEAQCRWEERLENSRRPQN